MTKVGASQVPPPSIAKGNVTATNTTNVPGLAKDDSKTKRRRQSAPAQAGLKGAASRAAGSGGRKRRIPLDLPKVREDGDGEGEL